MWFQARQEEKKLRHIMIDHKKRIDRRRMFYEKIKKDPVEFMQLHARNYKIHMDASIWSAAESQAILRPWQGDSSVLIDRFDVRSHLDVIHEYKQHSEIDHDSFKRSSDRLLDFERFRVLIFNDFEKISEDKFLKQINMEESGKVSMNALVKLEEEKKKKLAMKKAAISFNYNTGDEDHSIGAKKSKVDDSVENDMGDDSSDSEYEPPDFDKRLDVSELTNEQCSELNNIATRYGMKMGDFVKCMWEEYEEQAELQNLKEIEDERMALAGKQSRRERKLLKEIRIRDRGMVSNPLDVLRIQKINAENQHNKTRRLSGSSTSSSSSSRSSRSGGSRHRSEGRRKETIEFITTFGGQEGCDDFSGDEGHRNPGSPTKPESTSVVQKSMPAVALFSGSPPIAAVDKRKCHQEPKKSPNPRFKVSASSREKQRCSRSRSSSRRRHSSRDPHRRYRLTPTDRRRHSKRSRSRSPSRYRRRSRSASSHRRRYSKSRSKSRTKRRSRSREDRKRSIGSPNGLNRPIGFSYRFNDQKPCNNRAVKSCNHDVTPTPVPPAIFPSARTNLGGANSGDESDLSLLPINSEMSDSEQERVQVENTRRRLKKSKKALISRVDSKPGSSSNGASLDSSADLAKQPKILSALDKLKLQTQKALRKNLAKDREEARLKMEESRREQEARDEEIRDLALQMRSKERERLDSSPGHKHRHRSSSSSSDGSRRKTSSKKNRYSRSRSRSRRR